MSTHYSSNQFESAFVPCRLQNYELPREHKEYPSRRLGCTKIIANDRGHVTFERSRSSTSPWGHFMGTWQKPCNPVQLRVRTKLMAGTFNMSSTDQIQNDSPIPKSPDMGGTAVSQSPAQENLGSNLSKQSEHVPDTRDHDPVDDTSTSHLSRLSNSPSVQSKENSNVVNRNPGSSIPGSSVGSSKVTGSRPPSSVKSNRSTSRPPSNVSHNEKLSLPPSRASSIASSRVSSAPVNRSRSGASSASVIGSSMSQRPCSQLSAINQPSRPDSRQGSAQHSVLGVSDGQKGSRSFSSTSVDSRPSTVASIALTSSTIGDIKSRGVQCPQD